MQTFRNMTAVVTGGATGIGEAISSRLASDGMNVFIVQRNEAEAKQGRSNFSGHPGSSRICVAAHDIATPQGCISAIKECSEYFGDINILVNNAGISGEYAVRELNDCDDDQIDLVIDTNLKAPMRLSREALPYLAKNKGVIVNISSVAQFIALSQAPSYIASKAGIGGLTRSLGLDLAPKGIRVVGIAPGDIETTTSRSPDLVAKREKMTLVKKVPAGYSAKPADIASAVSWVVTDEARYITGTTIVIDGALTTY